MEICRHNDHIEISELDPFLAELLRQIPASTSPDGVPAAEQRLFSSPANRKETELCAEWKMYVEPELRRLFQSATETVAADLEQLNGNEKSLANRTLRIPAKHADAWLSALNQVRPESLPDKLLRFSAGIHPARLRRLRDQDLRLRFFSCTHHFHEAVFDCG